MTQRDAWPRDLPEEVVAELVAAATLAPSMHNTQPWRFQFDPAGETISLYADPARMLPVADPDGRSLHISCGAALFNLRLAVAVAGRQPVVRLIPDPGQPLLLATLRLAGRVTCNRRNSSCARPLPRGAPTGAHSAAVRYHQVFWRSWPRRPGSRAACCIFLTARRSPGCSTSPGRLSKSCSPTPAYRVELARWTGGARDDQGIPEEDFGPRDPSGATPVRDFTAARPGLARYAWFEDEPQLAVLATSFDDPADWLRAGQALERVLLVATVRGVAASPLTQPLEVASSWLVRDPQSGMEYPQMILRLGYGLPVGRAPRRPVCEVLETHSAR